MVMNNAGIAEPMFSFESDLSDKWEKTIDIDLNAVIRGTKMAIKTFRDQNSGGVIVNTASLAGTIPAGTLLVS